MPTDELTRLGIADAGEQIRKGSLSPAELTRAYLDRIQRLDGGCRAYITVLHAEAMTAATAAEQEIARRPRQVVSAISRETTGDDLPIRALIRLPQRRSTNEPAPRSSRHRSARTAFDTGSEIG